MNRIINRHQHEEPSPHEEYMSALSQRQASESDILEQAKQLLCDLWRENRIDMETRSAGEAALSAAHHAVEFPGIRKVGMKQGASLSERQWMKKQQDKDNAF